MEAFKRLENEDENAYMWRACDNKDLIGTWQDVCNLLNEELHHDYNESWYRKMYQSFMMVFDSIKDKYFNNEQLKQMEQKKQEIIKERYRLNDERTAYNRALRNDARLDARLDMLEQKITEFGRISFPDVNNIHTGVNDNDLLVLLSDLHIGQTFKSFNGEYNTKIAQTRMGQYLKKIIEIGKQYNSDKCYVSLQGDLISNSIHKSIAITNQENVIQQIKFASELITAFIYELSHNFNRVIVTSVSGNHSRLDKKEDALKDERLDDLVIWYVDAALKNVNNVDIITNNPDTTFAVMDIRGKKYINVHGDYDAFSKNGVASLSMMLGFFPYAITFGHLHTCAMSDESGIKIIRGGSLAGSGDDYTIEKRLTGKASQMVCVCTDKGIESYNIVELD